jgi:hypothetical protein
LPWVKLSSKLSSKTRNIFIVMNIIGGKGTIANVTCRSCSIMCRDISFVKRESTVATFYAEDLKRERKRKSNSVSRRLGSAMICPNRVPYFIWQLSLVTSRRACWRSHEWPTSIRNQIFSGLTAASRCLNRLTFRRPTLTPSSRSLHDLTPSLSGIYS